MNKLVLVVLALLVAPLMQAQVPTLVKDLSPAGSDPYALTIWRNEIWFIANDLRNGNQLWHTDGKSDPQMVSNPVIQINGYSEMVVYNDKLYFRGETFSGGMELCSYDGTGIPKVVTDVMPGKADADPSWLTVFRGKLFFAASDPNLGRELMSYEEGVGVKTYDVYPGATSSNPCNLKVYNDQLYFSPFDCGLTGLYLLDKVADTARKVSGVRIDGNGFVALAGNKMFFRGSVNGDTAGLVSFDGTASTQLTSAGAIMPIVTLRYVPIATWGADVYFAGSHADRTAALYKYSSATRAVSKIVSFPVDSVFGGPLGNDELLDAAVFDNALYFGALIDGKGYELYRYDGQAVRLVADLNPGAESSLPTHLTVFDNQLYMSANDGKNGTELFRLSTSLAVQAAGWSGSSVTIYPNPAPGTATLSFVLAEAQSLKITLQDISGRQVYATGLVRYGSGRQSVGIPLNGLASGAYTFSIRGSNNALLASGALMKQ